AETKPSDSDRKAEIAERFAYLEDGILEGEARVEEENAQKICRSYESEALRSRVLEHAASLENVQDEKDLIGLYQQIDSASAIKKGKKALAVSYRDACKAYYDGLSAEHGEEAGSFVEFSGTILNLYNAYKAEGGTKTIDAYLSEEMTWDVYQAALEIVRNEEKAEAQSNPMEHFVDLIEAKAAGEDVDFEAYYRDVYSVYLQKYPDTQISYGRFVVCLNGLLTDTKKDFFGTYEEINAAVEKEAGTYKQTTFPAFMAEFSAAVLKDADDRAEVKFDHRFSYWSWSPVDFGGSASVIVNILLFIPRILLVILQAAGNIILLIPRALNNLCVRVGLNIPAVLWKQAEYTWLFWTVGAALVLISILISILLNRYVLKRCKVKNGVEEEDSDVLLRVEHLKQYFRSKSYVNKAVDDISFFIKKGEVFGLVGESGCGKTTTGRTIINLYDPTDGDVYFKGQRISTTEKGLSTLLRQLKNDYKLNKMMIRRQLKQAQKNGDQAVISQCRAKLAELSKQYDADTSNAYIHTMESRIEKKNSTRMYREKAKKKLAEDYEQDVKQLDDPALIAQRTAVYKQQLAHVKKENIMTKMQMIFQDPIASINPRMTVREIIAEGLKIRGVKDSEYINRKVVEMLELVGLVPEHMDRYPHEFSGGQRQRIGIARAVIMEPDLIIADEPISALDVSIQAQVLNLLNELRESMGLTILFIAHNLSVVKFFSDRIAVMYYGKIVEMTTSDELFAHPLHPYTKSLLSAIPYPDPEYEKNRKRITYNPASEHDYSVSKPELKEIVPGHFIYCNEPEYEKYCRELGIK
ncbi:MAG: hypothetical protein CW338_11410, partial [Clostridiales bacterium]|nr:hypothetical protein [Clostridiales bacterium]